MVQADKSMESTYRDQRLYLILIKIRGYDNKNKFKVEIEMIVSLIRRLEFLTNINNLLFFLCFF
jgi:hypothetical protein